MKRLLFPNSPRDRSGLTIVEVIVSTMLVGVLIVSAMKCVGQTLAGRHSVAQQARAKALAQQLMTEIMRDPYKDPGVAVMGLEVGELPSPRSWFDDVDDYHNWSASPPVDRSGNPLPNLVGWRRTVTVQFVEPNNPTVVSATDQGLKRMTVNVLLNGKVLATLIALRSETVP